MKYPGNDTILKGFYVHYPFQASIQIQLKPDSKVLTYIRASLKNLQKFVKFFSPCLLLEQRDDEQAETHMG